MRLRRLALLRMEAVHRGGSPICGILTACCHISMGSRSTIGLVDCPVPKLLLLSTAGGGIGGTERVVISLARAFTARGWSVRAVFPDTATSAAVVHWASDQGVSSETQIALLGVERPRTIGDMLALRRLVRSAKPDVVNLHYGVGHISLKDVLAVRLAGQHRCVITVHHPTPLHGMTRRLTRLAAMLAHDIVAVSRATRSVLTAAGVPDRNIHLIPSGLPTPKELPSRMEARRCLGLREDAFVVASVTRLVPEKGIGDLLAAVADLAGSEQEAVVVVAGDGPERQSLEGFAAEHLGHRALILGRVRDTADVYAAADVFALPSSMEGFGLVYIEAAFHGVPSVGTTAGGIPDAVVDGETGLLVSPGDIPALTGALRRLRDDPSLRRRLGEAARARARAEFTEDRMADRYAALFRR